MMTQEVTRWLGNKQSITRRYRKKIACWNLTYIIDRSEREKSRDICAALCSTASTTTTTTTSFHVSIALLSFFSRDGENGRYITSDSSRSYPHQCPTPSTAKSGGRRQEMLVLHQNMYREREKKKYCCIQKKKKIGIDPSTENDERVSAVIFCCVVIFTHISSSYYASPLHI